MSHRAYFEQAKTAKIAFELYFYDNLNRLLQPNKPSGCMLVVATMNCSESTQQVQHTLLSKRLKTKHKLLERLQQGIIDGDLPANAPIETMTDFMPRCFRVLRYRHVMVQI